MNIQNIHSGGKKKFKKKKYKNNENSPYAITVGISPWRRVFAEVEFATNNWV